MKSLEINFVLANRTPNSVSGVVVNFANQLVKQGHTVTVSYPTVEWWDYHVWQCDSKYASVTKTLWSFMMYYWNRYIPLLKALPRLLLKSSFHGGLHVRLDSRVKKNNFFWLPNNVNMPDADYLIVLHDYFCPKFVSLYQNKGVLISSVRTSYEAILESQHRKDDWFKTFLTISQKIHIPRFAVSKAASEAATKFGVRVDGIVPNGIDHKVFIDTKQRRNKDLILTCLVDSSRHIKGSTYGVESIVMVKEKLKNMGFDVQFTCFGAQANTLEDGSNLQEIFDEVCGFVRGEDLVRVLQATDIFVFPTLLEGFSSMLLEAMACGCAIVSTTAPGVDEIAVDEENGLYSPVKDTAAMSENIVRLIRDSALRDKIRDNAVKTAKRFTWEKSADQLVAFLNRVDQESISNE